MKKLIFFSLIVTSLTFVLFWQVFIQNKIPFSANLLASSFNPWMQEKFPGWEVGIPNKPTGQDDLTIFYPQRTFTTSVFKNFDIPFWNPYSFTGNYQLGLSETAVFYPLNLLFLIFSQIDAWVILTVIEPIIAGIGMYLFLKRVVLNEKSAIFGALAFAFSGVVLVRAVEGLSVGHTLIWLPYAFWAIESYFQEKKVRFLWLTLLPLSFSLLAGWFQFTFYTIVFAFIYAIFKLRTSKKSSLNYLIIIPFLILPLVTLFHIIPALQAFLDSPRSGLEGRLFSQTHLMPPAHLFTLIFPDFWGNPAVYNFFGKSVYKESVMFIGIVPFILASITFFKQKSKTELFFILSIIISLFLAIASPISRLLTSSSLPIFSTFLPDRIFLITTFAFCVLAAFGMDFLLTNKKAAVFRTVKKVFILLWIVVLTFLLISFFDIFKNPKLLNIRTGEIGKLVISFRNSIIPIMLFFVSMVLFFVYRNKYGKNLFFVAITIVFFLQAFLFGQKYIPFSNRQFVYPSHPVFSFLKDHQGLDRFMSIGAGHIVSNMPLEFGLYSPEGAGAMYPRRYGEFARYMKLGDYGIPDKIAFDLEIYPKDVFTPKNQRLNRFFQLTNVKYLVVDKRSMVDSVAPEEDYNLVWENKKWQIYQYKRSMPRVFTTSDYEVIPQREKILNSLFGSSFNPDKIILEENPGFKAGIFKGTVKITNYSPNKVSMDVEASQSALVYLSDNYSKAFKVLIDGKEGKILRANYTFRAVPIKKGKHKLEMIYDTQPFFLSVFISLFTLIIALSASILYSRRSNNN